MDSWLITGATGFLGSNLGTHLQGRIRTIGVVRPGQALSSSFQARCDGSLETVEALASSIVDWRPRVIVHAAALASHEVCERDPTRAFEINAQATQVLSAAAEAISAKFVYISTDAVFDGSRGHYTEDDVPSPTSVYGQSKLSGEHLASQTTDALIVRTNFFGWSPTGTRSILEFFVNELSAGRRVRGFTDFTTTSAYAQALAQAIEGLVDAEASGIFHVTSPDALTKYEFGLAVATEFDLDPDLITPSRADIHPPRTGDISLNVSKAQAALGRALPSQRAGLAAAHVDAAALPARLRA